MYISLHSCECNYPTATPYKEFPINILLENITCLLSDHSNPELAPLKELTSQLRHANDHEQVLIDYIHKNGTPDPDNLMTTKSTHQKMLKTNSLKQENRITISLSLAFQF